MSLFTIMLFAATASPASNVPLSTEVTAPVVIDDDAVATEEEAAAFSETVPLSYERLTEMMSWAICMQDTYVRPAAENLKLLDACQQAARKHLLDVLRHFDASGPLDERAELQTGSTLSASYARINRCMEALDDVMRTELPYTETPVNGGDTNIQLYCSPYVLYRFSEF